MEEPLATDAADDEYMTMDADKWSDNDDTYENGDTLDLDVRGKKDSRVCESGPDSGEQTKELTEENVAATRTLQNTQSSITVQPPVCPLTNRYVTIRRPPKYANRRPGKNQSRQLGKVHT